MRHSQKEAINSGNVISVSRQIGQVLIDRGVISEDQLRISLLEQEEHSQPLGRLLVQLGFVTESVMRDALEETLGQRAVDLSNLTVDPAALDLLPIELARRHHCMPLALDKDNGRLSIAMADPGNLFAVDRIRAQLAGRYEIEPLLSGEVEIARAIDKYYGHTLSIDGILHEIETGEIDQGSLALNGNEYSHPVVRLVDALLADAFKADASDIHFEPEACLLRIRYRIDGMLHQVRALHKSCWAAMVVRIKVMSGMNIAESRAPQDGRITLCINGHAVDFRVATQPTLHGENIVLRILDRQKGIVALQQLGLQEEHVAELNRMIARPEGIILLTGPTGSGKTTTLYSILHQINSEGVNIMTLEDPVEYPMSMVRQTSIGDAVRLDFASGIRAMMRQDPDVILVGEIRDAETAEMAFRAAMTGHQVYSTLHSNSALGALPRLLDIGIDPALMAGNIIGVIAQRLVRRLCVHCREAVEANEAERRLFGMADGARVVHYRAQGCADCRHRGYKGRLAILEILRMDEDLDELVAHRASQREIRLLAARKGFRTLAENAVQRVREGMTSLEEVARVVDLSGRLQ